MHYWMETTSTIVRGVGFAHFDRLHLMWLMIFILFTITMCYVYRKADASRRIRLRRRMANAIAADELFKTAVLVIGGNYTADHLPLHLCSINIFLIALHARRPGRTLDNFLYAVCFPGALAALLFPGWTQLPLANFMHIHCFTVHILLAAYPIMLTVGGDIRPDVRQIPKCLGLLTGLVCIALVSNLCFGTNFMFLMEAPRGNPLRWFQDRFSSHLAGYGILIPGVLAAMYAPVVIFGKILPKSTSPSCNRLRKMLK